MLRGDVDQSVVAAAGHTPFEASWRVFVLERVDTMDDPAANTLLKTLEEPPSYVVLILLTDKPTQVLPTITSRCQGVRFDPLPPLRLAERLESQRRRADRRAAPARGCRSATASARWRSRSATGPPCAPAPRRSPARALRGEVGRSEPWSEVLAPPAPPAAPPRPSSSGARRGARVPAQEGAPPQADRVHRARPPRRPPRRDRRARPRAPARRALVPRPRLPGRRRRGARARHRPARGAARRRRDVPLPAALQEALELVEDTRARLPFNVSYDLALQALAYRLERTLGGDAVTA